MIALVLATVIQFCNPVPVGSSGNASCMIRPDTGELECCLIDFREATLLDVVHKERSAYKLAEGPDKTMFQDWALYFRHLLAHDPNAVAP